MFTFTCRNDSPSCSGFMQIAIRSRNHEKTRVQILPFIHLDPSNPSTIYTALCFAKNQCELHHVSRRTCFVTFDQPPYAKAVEIVAASSDLANVGVRLGGSIYLCPTWVQSDSSWVAVDWKLCGKLFMPQDL